MKNKPNIINFKSVKILKKKKKKISIIIDYNQKIDLLELEKNYLVVKVKYSNLNFKDTIMCSPNSKLVKKYPHTPGIDASGEVYFSNSKKFKKNDRVFIIGRPLGVLTNGGLSEYVLVHHEWVEALPKNLSFEEMMLIGTSGFTAVKSYLEAQKIINDNKKKTVLITGSNSNVGIFLIYFLKKKKIKVQVTTSNLSSKKFFVKIGVDKVYENEHFIKKNNFNLMNEKYSVVFDNLGSDVLNNCLKYIIKGGNLISIGNILGNKTSINLLPFILRGIKMNGINTENLKKSERLKIIMMIKNSNILNNLKKITKKIKLEQVPKILAAKVKNQNKFKYIVKI